MATGPEVACLPDMPVRTKPACQLRAVVLSTLVLLTRHGQQLNLVSAEVQVCNLAVLDAPLFPPPNTCRCIKGIVKSARYAGSRDDSNASLVVPQSAGSGSTLNPGAAAFVPGASFSARPPSCAMSPVKAAVKQSPPCWGRMADLPEHLVSGGYRV
jgi:hypothetical protein